MLSTFFLGRTDDDHFSDGGLKTERNFVLLIVIFVMLITLFSVLIMSLMIGEL